MSVLDKAHEAKDVDISMARRGLWLVKVRKHSRSTINQSEIAQQDLELDQKRVDKNQDLTT